MDEAARRRAQKAKNEARCRLYDSLSACIVDKPDAKQLSRIVRAHPKWIVGTTFKPRYGAWMRGYVGHVNALQLAVAWSRPSCVRALLSSDNIDVNQRSHRNTTALEEAALRFCEEFVESDADNALECLRLIASHPALDHSLSRACGAEALYQVVQVPSKMCGNVYRTLPNPAWLQYARAAFNVLLDSPGICVFSVHLAVGGVVRRAIDVKEWDAVDAALAQCTTRQLLQEKRRMEMYEPFDERETYELSVRAVSNEIEGRRRWVMRSHVVRTLVLTSRRGTGRAVLRHTPRKAIHLVEL